METLTTERLVLRPFTTGDHDFVADLHRHPGIERFIPSQATTTPERTSHQLERFTSYADHPVHGMWCVTLADGRPVGLLMLKPIPFSADNPRADGESDLELGWRIHVDHEGNGYATEAARRVLEHAWGAGLPRVVAVTDPENHPSMRVCTRLGMRDAGLTDDYYDETVRLFVLERPDADETAEDRV
ncbi:GNAT family N-acetyltransferase [Kytococcus sedentarius]|uniref:Acetyltransferase, ribosomal protein N-acetylase n=1 Tax=Kytococcus sedentarius (strain ATCC 14392 / DSM 20547 / JCM 11482 / CCUG 33030 / NBRC 15357 / NCTC 11040 / CCM 314 / 541) TaxID=478801 RepID=C7NLA2_KYTSD|nr:GNAT family N-acetyltransferase [Kytococcus sedentarius]ACV05644.1 acetyltransferase, ribosomal protein N-acetylase [Kytococcus sedentarius DSM 20547]QQB64068.1 GNAT family N-acetyltransferase [Kytococcus sedentarius]STX12940.1 Acetyltransferase (GNAT) family [Kytococcus sedentarius]